MVFCAQLRIIFVSLWFWFSKSLREKKKTMRYHFSNSGLFFHILSKQMLVCNLQVLINRLMYKNNRFLLHLSAEIAYARSHKCQLSKAT